MIAKVSKFRKKQGSILEKKALAWFFVALTGLLGLFLIFYNIRIYQKRAELQEQAKQLQDEIADLTQREQDLQRQLEISVTPEYQERVLREQGLYQRPGEEVVTVISGEEPEQQQEQKEEKVWWQPWTWFK